jgi:hypothetical protein
MAARIVVTRRTDVPGECDAGSPGSGGASPYLRPGGFSALTSIVLALMGFRFRDPKVERIWVTVTPTPRSSRVALRLRGKAIRLRYAMLQEAFAASEPSRGSVRATPPILASNSFNPPFWRPLHLSCLTLFGFLPANGRWSF